MGLIYIKTQASKGKRTFEPELILIQIKILVCKGASSFKPEVCAGARPNAKHQTLNPEWIPQTNLGSRVVRGGAARSCIRAKRGQLDKV